ncbi:MAG: hypothetical protein U0L92_01155, partial [Clostridia bacterium]|nr:hypothetical protein [Clostridia bacterium]
MKWNRKYAGITAGVVAVAVAASGVGYWVINANATEGQTDKSQGNAMGEAIESDGNTLVEEGTTQIRTESQEPAFSVNVVTMTVEEVYVEAGTTVEEGDALFKITAESMEEARAY